MDGRRRVGVGRGAAVEGRRPEGLETSCAGSAVRFVAGLVAGLHAGLVTAGRCTVFFLAAGGLTGCIASGGSIPATAGDSPSPAASSSTLTGDSLLRDLLADPRIAPLLADPAEHRVQVLLGTIEPTPDGDERLIRHGYRLDAEYFYPASTVKLPAAVAAVATLAELRRTSGRPVGLDTPLAIHPSFAGETLEDADPEHLDDGTLTAGQEIRKVFLVSDNASFNRLYALVGQEALNRRMWRAGLGSVRIVHRLSMTRSAEENRRTPEIELRVADGDPPLVIPARRSALELPPLDQPGLRIGRAHLGAEGERIDGPLDFAPKNRISLTDLQNALAMVVRPDLDLGLPPTARPFDLADADRAFLLRAMAELPRESADPRYDPAEYPDDYVKFLLPGLLRVAPRADWEVYDKTGQAYGFVIENAYVVHRPSGRAFFLAATVYANSDAVLNDDRYDYDDVALPFVADLAEAVARHVLGRAAVQ